jgi:O-antigen/teichoic acid export membrane protein
VSGLSLRAIFGQFAVYGVSDALIKVLGVVTVVVYTRVFTPAEYGTISLIGAFAGLLSIVGGLGISSAVQRGYFAAGEGERATIVSTGYWGVLGIAGSVAAVGALLSPLFAWGTFGSIEHAGLVVVALLAIPLTQLMAYCQDVIRMHFRPWRFTMVAFLNQVGQVAFGVGLVVLAGLGLYGLFSGIVVGAGLALMLGTVWIGAELGGRFSWPMLRSFIGYGAPLALGGLAFPAFLFIDRLILEHFQGAAAVGHLAVALSVAQAMGLVSGSFGKAWNAMAWRLRHHNAEYRGIYADVLLYLVAVFAVAAVGIAAFAPEIVRILAPPVFADAAVAVAPLTAYMMANVSIQVTAAGISISGRTRFLTMTIWGAVVLNVLLDLALIPVWGIFGAALATAIAETAMTLVIAAISQRLHPLPYDYPRLFGCLALLVGFLALSYHLQAGWSPAAVAMKLAFIGAFVAGLFATTIVSWKRLMRTGAMLSGGETVMPAAAREAEG